jgi:hypothetical protein
VLDEVVVGQVFLRVVGLSTLPVIPRELRAHLQLRVAINEKRVKHGSLPQSKGL